MRVLILPLYWGWNVRSDESSAREHCTPRRTLIVLLDPIQLKQEAFCFSFTLWCLIKRSPFPPFIPCQDDAWGVVVCVMRPDIEEVSFHSLILSSRRTCLNCEGKNIFALHPQSFSDFGQNVSGRMSRSIMQVYADCLKSCLDCLGDLNPEPLQVLLRSSLPSESSHFLWRNDALFAESTVVLSFIFICFLCGALFYGALFYGALFYGALLRCGRVPYTSKLFPISGKMFEVGCSSI